MDFKNFLESYRGMRRGLKFMEVTVLGLAAADVILAAALALRRDAVVLVPPHLAGEARIVSGRVTSGYARAWGLFLAELIGNISPDNLEFVSKSLGPIISPAVYRRITDLMNVQAQEIMADHISIGFEPRVVTFEESGSMVYVTGQTRISGPSGPARSFLRTYEFSIAMDGFRPMLEWIDMYEGNPRNGRDGDGSRARGKKEPRADGAF